MITQRILDAVENYGEARHVNGSPLYNVKVNRALDEVKALLEEVEVLCNEARLVLTVLDKFGIQSNDELKKLTENLAMLELVHHDITPYCGFGSIKEVEDAAK